MRGAIFFILYGALIIRYQYLIKIDKKTEFRNQAYLDDTVIVIS